MRSLQYGSNTIQYNFLERRGLKSHYITVERGAGVILKGKAVPQEMADRMILKKAKWILNKLDVITAPKKEAIVTGSRVPFLGKNYYVEVKLDNTLTSVNIAFTQSKFLICTPSDQTTQNEISKALNSFYKDKAKAKITPRVVALCERTGLRYRDLLFRKMAKRWGSCTADNAIIVNPTAMQLPYSLIDYIILHELCHTRVKDHSKRYYSLLSRYVPNWKTLDERVRTWQLAL